MSHVTLARRRAAEDRQAFLRLRVATLPAILLALLFVVSLLVIPRGFAIPVGFCQPGRWADCVPLLQTSLLNWIAAATNLIAVLDISHVLRLPIFREKSTEWRWVRGRLLGLQVFLIAVLTLDSVLLSFALPLDWRLHAGFAVTALVATLGHLVWLQVRRSDSVLGLATSLLATLGFAFVTFFLRGNPDPNAVRSLLANETLGFALKVLHLIAVPLAYLVTDLMNADAPIEESANSVDLDAALVVVGFGLFVIGTVMAFPASFMAGAGAVMLLLGNWVYEAYVSEERMKSLSFPRISSKLTRLTEVSAREKAKQWWDYDEAKWRDRDGQDIYYRSHVTVPALRMSLEERGVLASPWCLVELGGGDGIATHSLIASLASPPTSVVVFDKSARSLDVARLRIPTAVTFHGDLSDATFVQGVTSSFSIPHRKVVSACFLLQEMESLDFLDEFAAWMSSGDLFVAIVVHPRFATQLRRRHSILDVCYPASGSIVDWEWMGGYPIDVRENSDVVIHVPHFQRSLTTYVAALRSARLSVVKAESLNLGSRLLEVEDVSHRDHVSGVFQRSSYGAAILKQPSSLLIVAEKQ